MNVRIKFCSLLSLLLIASMVFSGSASLAQSEVYICNFFGNKITKHDAATGAIINQLGIQIPTAAEVGPDGFLYTVGYDRVIRKYDRTTLSQVATLATQIATFPDDLHFGPDGKIYIACELGPGILRYNTDGTPAPSPGNSGAVFYSSNGRFISTAFGTDGNVYATDFGANTVIKISPTGTLLGNFITSHLSGPIDLRFSSDGKLFVSSRADNTVSRFNGTTGAFIDVFASGNGLNKTDGFDFGPNGDLYVVSRNNNSVFTFSGSTGAINGTFTSTGLSDPYRIRFYGVAVVGPVISGITPPTAPVNSPAIQLTIKGSGFSPNPTVRFNNTALTLVSSTSSTIVATVPASFMTSTKTWNVTVSVNGKTSNSTQFRVLPLISPPKLTRVGNYRTGVDQFAGNRYAVLLFQNQGSSDLTNINFSNVRLYVNGTGYVVPFNISIEPGANPAGTLLNTPPGSLLQVRFDFPDFAPPVGSVVRMGTLDVLGTSAQGAFNAGSLFLVFP